VARNWASPTSTTPTVNETRQPACQASIKRSMLWCEGLWTGRPNEDISATLLDTQPGAGGAGVRPAGKWWLGAVGRRKPDPAPALFAYLCRARGSPLMVAFLKQERECVESLAWIDRSIHPAFVTALSGRFTDGKLRDAEPMNICPPTSIKARTSAIVIGDVKASSRVALRFIALATQDLSAYRDTATTRRLAEGPLQGPELRAGSRDAMGS